MSDEIDNLQSRIMAALDRIADGLNQADAEPVAETSAEAEAEQAALRQQLDDERLANAQLEARVKALNARVNEIEQAQMSVDQQREADAEERKAAMRKMDAEVQALRLANEQLRQNNATLREANSTGVVEPHLINKAMMAELEGLRATRAAEQAELALIHTDIKQLAGDDADAPSGEGDASGEGASQDAPDATPNEETSNA